MCFLPGWLTFIKTSDSHSARHCCGAASAVQAEAVFQPVIERPALPPTALSLETPDGGGLCLCFAAILRRRSGEPSAPGRPGSQHRWARPPTAGSPTASPSLADADTELSEPAAACSRCSPAQQAKPHPVWAPPLGPPPGPLHRRRLQDASGATVPSCSKSSPGLAPAAASRFPTWPAEGSSGKARIYPGQPPASGQGPSPHPPADPHFEVRDRGGNMVTSSLKLSNKNHPQVDTATVSRAFICLSCDLRGCVG